jgi:2-polyprenyl-6-hydroxyphenyl methylase/3-demethylubiquinone-9 3-methyltransferase
MIYVKPCKSQLWRYVRPALYPHRVFHSSAASAKFNLNKISPASLSLQPNISIPANSPAHTVNLAHSWPGSSPNSSAAPSSAVDPAEISKFNHLADGYWDEFGPYALLHRANPLRINYILQHILRHRINISPFTTARSAPLQSLNILDVGCVGGLLSESLAALGAKLTSIDAADKNIKIAKQHAELHKGEKPFLDTIQYLHCTVEHLEAQKLQFDVVCALDVVQHIPSEKQSVFIQSVCNLVKPGGSLFVSSINKTNISWLLNIAAAEFFFEWCKKGLHNYNRFISPSVLISYIEKSQISQFSQLVGMEVDNITGILYNPLNKVWFLNASDRSANYILCAKRRF